MTRARARSLWLAGPALLAACSTSSGASPAATQLPATTTAAAPVTITAATLPATSPPATSTTVTAVPAPTTLVPIDPAVLVPLAVGNKPFPAPGDELAAEFHGYAGDPNATLAAWLVTPMAVPSGPDVRLLGFERTVGINTTTATFLTGAIDPDAALTTIQAALAPSPTYTVTPSTRSDGTTTIHSIDAQPTTVQGEPPGWTIDASVVDQLGIVRIKRSDYSFAKVVPTFSDLPAVLQSQVLNQDAIAVNIGGVMRSIAYEYGVNGLGDTASHRTRLGYDLTDDFPTARAKLAALLTSGWTTEEQPDSIFYTSTTTSEVWTLDDTGGFTHLTYDTGS